MLRNTLYKHLLLVAFFCSVTASASVLPADETMPGKVQTRPIALVGATIHTLAGKPIKNGTVLFEKGKITQVGTKVKLPKGTEKIDLFGKHVYPGMFEAHSQLGITELGSIRPTWDYAESGEFNPNVKANVAVNPDNIVLPVTRANGVLLALSAPSSGTISGKSAVLQLDGWTYEDMTLLEQAALQVSWPSTTISPRRMRFLGKDRIAELKKQQIKELQELNEYVETAKRYRDARSDGDAQQKFDARLEAMIPVVEKKVPLMIRANRLADIEAAVAFGLKHDLKIIILGGFDADLCAELLIDNEVAVIVSAVYRLPSRRHADYDAAYTLPKRLHDAGIKFCISGTDRSETWNTRTLPYHAATAAAYGLPLDEAYKSVSRYPAEILGVGDRVGSLEQGKDATLIITDGNPLETTTNVLAAFVQGRKLDLSSRHTRLYEKYKEKYARQK